MSSWAAPPTSLTDLPDEVLHALAHTYLDPCDILALSLACKHLCRTFLTHPHDIVLVKSLLGVHTCVQRGWWASAGVAVAREGSSRTTWTLSVFTRPATVSLATALLLNMARGPRGPLPVAHSELEDALEFASVLLAHPACNPGTEQSLVLRLAAKSGSAGLVELLLGDPRVDPSARDGAALVTAAGRGHLNVVAFLIADPRLGQPAKIAALRAAVDTTQACIVSALLADPQVDPDVWDGDVFLDAVLGGDPATVAAFLAHPTVHPARNGNEALRLAAELGHTAVFDLLAAHGSIQPSAVSLAAALFPLSSSDDA